MRGGSSLGYKRAGFEVIGNVEIDPAMNEIYVANNHPRYNYCMDLREFNKLDDLPEELYGVDILDGSPPCTSFSMAGVREEGWQKEKKFREGQKVQTLDDLFFVFLDTVEKLNPKIVVAENVEGIIKGKARGYCNEIIKRFKELGYDVQLFLLNAATMDVPQQRKRVFFIANRMGLPKLSLGFHNEPIPFGKVRMEKGKPLGTGQIATLVTNARPGDRDLSDVAKRINGSNNYFTYALVYDNEVCHTIVSGGNEFRMADKKAFMDRDYINVQTFPQDYDFRGKPVKYVCGMSVPPNMMANIGSEIWNQWRSVFTDL